MLDFSFLEVALVGIVALVVLGPEKLPHAARMAGALIGKLTRMANSVRAEIEREVNLMEMQQRIKKQVEDGMLGDVRDSLQQAQRMMREGYDTPPASPTPTTQPPAAATVTETPSHHASDTVSSGVPEVTAPPSNTANPVRPGEQA